MRHIVKEKLARLRAEPGAEPGRHCPPETKYRELAAGYYFPSWRVKLVRLLNKSWADLLQTAETRQLAEHASDCDHCAVHLRQSVKDFANDETELEKEELNQVLT